MSVPPILYALVGERTPGLERNNVVLSLQTLACQRLSICTYGEVENGEAEKRDRNGRCDYFHL